MDDARIEARHAQDNSKDAHAPIGRQKELHENHERAELASNHFASSQLTELPGLCFRKYRRFIRDNASSITTAESTLRSVIQLLPSRFHQTPIAAEAVHTGLTLLTSLHNSLLSSDSRISQDRESSIKYDPHILPHRRYELWAGAKSAFYARALGLLRTIQYTQLLLEMCAKRMGETARWRTVVVLELIKAVCRFLLLRLSGNRPVINSQMPGNTQERKLEVQENGYDKHERAERADLLEIQDHSSPINSSNVVDPTYRFQALDAQYKMPRTGGILPPLPAASTGQSISEFLDCNILTAEQVRPAHHLVHRLQSLKSATAESLYILRPVLYALALQYIHNSRSHSFSSSDSSCRGQRWHESVLSIATRADWRPWLLGIGLEIISRELGKSSVDEEIPGGQYGLSTVERDEIHHRTSNMLWWVARGAFYERVAAPVVRRIAKTGRGKFGLDLLTGVIEDYDWLLSEHYFASSTL